MSTSNADEAIRNQIGVTSSDPFNRQTTSLRKKTLLAVAGTLVALIVISKRDREVGEITELEYFRDLTDRAKNLRRRDPRASNAPT